MTPTLFCTILNTRTSAFLTKRTHNLNKYDYFSGDLSKNVLREWQTVIQLHRVKQSDLNQIMSIKVAFVNRPNTCQHENQSLGLIITKTRLYNFDPLKPHFYIVKMGFTGVYIICLISAQNIDCGYSLEPPRRGGSNEYPQSMF